LTGRLILGETELRFDGVTHVMAVINLSPESRNAHSIARHPRHALEMARRYQELGATIIDLGAQSSHHESPTLEADEEIARLAPVVETLASEGLLVSVDTWKPAVAGAALSAGAVMINDTGGLRDPEMVEVLAQHRAAVIAVYVEGAHPHDVGEVDTGPAKAARTAQVMAARLHELGGLSLDRVVVDPGIAINYRGDYEAYTRLQLQVIRDIAELRSLGRPILIPIPRKKEDHRVAAYITLALEFGADLIRVHDVEMGCDLVRLFDRAASS
jgi:dihydropteroate synthase